jgi:hypothetical protein
MDPFCRKAGGSTVASFPRRFQGGMADIVIFDEALPDGERRRMEDYFREHWQLP